jgi:methylated-DNA-[protein]-cysteine S-methyltransferase
LELPLCPFDVLRRFSSQAQPLSCSAKHARMVTPMKHHVYSIMPSPVGRLKLVASDKGLAAILWQNDDPKRVRLEIAGKDDAHPVLVETRRQLGEYFAGKRTAFNVKLDFSGTDFQKKVWRALLAIPFGQTRSYGQIAKAVGKPAAMRAVGAANGRNPISIIAPCHRVIGANGKLTGFAGGLKAKAQLLTLEGGAARRLTSSSA